MPPRAVWSPVAVTRTRRLPSPLIVPAITLAPGIFLTGRDSPVIMASFRLDSPSVTSPSAGTLAPGLLSSADRSPLAPWPLRPRPGRVSATARRWPAGWEARWAAPCLGSRNRRKLRPGKSGRAGWPGNRRSCPAQQSPGTGYLPRTGRVDESVYRVCCTPNPIC